MLTNVFSGVPSSESEERFVDLLARSREGVRIERIVSFGQASPAGFWYDQAHGEWVLVLVGEARVRFEDEADARTLRPGDFLNIPAHRRHRVDWTLPGAPTVWLAVHYGLTP